MIWLVSITFSYCLGIIFSGNFIQYQLLWLSFFIFPLLCVLIRKTEKQNYFYTMAVLPFIFLISVYWTEYRNPKPLNDDISYQSNKNKITMQGIIINEPTIKEDSISFILNVNQILKPYKQKVSGNVMIKVYTEKSTSPLQLEYSQNVIITGSLFNPLEAAGTFSYKEYLKRQGIFCQMVINDSKYVNLSEIHHKDILYRIISIRNHILNLYQKYMPKSSANFIGSLVFGAKASSVDKKIQDDFRKLGLSHILAASGFQVALLLAVFLWIGKFRGKRKILSKLLIIIISSLVLGTYIIMTGAPPSIQRAGVVGFLTLIGLILGRSPDPMPALILAVLIILLYWPLTFYDIGFQMSVIATFALIYTVPFLIEKIECFIIHMVRGIKMKFLPKIIAGFIAVPLSAQLWVLPLQLHYFGQFSWLFLPANIISALFVAALSYLAFISSVLALIFPFILVILCPILSFILNIYLYIIELFNKIPYSLLYTSNISILILILSFIFLFALIEWGKRVNDNYKPFQAVSYLSAIILIFNYIISNFITFNQLNVTFFAVGHGDACLIQTPFKKTILIDGGPSYKRFNAGERYIIPYLKQTGINKIDLIILSCPDYEHVGGLIPVLKQYNVKQVWDFGYTKKTKVYNKFLNEILYKQIPYTKINKGQKWEIEPYVEINIIHPRISTFLEDKDKSIVFKLTYKNISFLFTGDINNKAEEEILNTYENVKAEVLKIPDHGSKNSLSIEFLKKVNPKIAVICIGKDKKIKYPHQEILQKLNNCGVNILQTDKLGHITITTDGNKSNYF